MTEEAVTISPSSEKSEKRKLGVQAKCFDLVLNLPQRAPGLELVSSIEVYRSYVMASLEVLSQSSGHLLGCLYATSIHDKDVDADGCEETPHIHAYVETDTRHTLSAVLNCLVKQLQVNAESISIAKCHDRIRSVRYLVHKDSPSKFQYDVSVVECSKKFAPLCYEYLSLDDCSHISVQDLLMLCQSSNYDEINIMSRMGMQNYQKYRWCVKDVINAYIERKRQAKEDAERMSRVNKGGTYYGQE